MSVRETSPKTMPITQGSLDKIESIKVTGEKKVISSLLALCPHQQCRDYKGKNSKIIWT